VIYYHFSPVNFLRRDSVVRQCKGMEAAGSAGRGTSPETPLQKPALIALAAALSAATPFAAMEAAAQERGGRAFARVDANSDGAIDKDEVTKLRAETFSRLDKDGDGIVTQAEADAAKKRARERATGSNKTLFEQADANGDGKVTREEYLGAPRPIFDRADANKDGKLTPEEFRAFADQVRQGR
jgi:Ca2+-binding EF-hand superfamily protein